MIPFVIGPTATLSATTSSSRVQMGSAGAQIRIASPSANAIVYIAFGDSSVVATTSDMPLLPGTVEMFTIVPGQYIAGITASGSATLSITSGRGA